MLTYGSLFTGVGGFDQGFDRAGMKCLWQCEWDKSCQKLLQAKWANTKLYGDITTIKAGQLERVDVICGGSPCQDLSVAGLRAGMAGVRSGLFHEMVRICKRVRPRVIVWENVDGAFSSNAGRDFASVLRAFTGIQVEVPVDGWGRAGFIKTPFAPWRWHCAWRVFDAQYFGVPQRRRRVFLVASLGDGSCSEILFEPESLRGDSPPSRDAGQRIAGSISARTEGGGGLGTDFELGGGCAKLLKASDGGIDRKDGHTLIPVITGALDFGGHGGTYNGQDAYNGKLLPVVGVSESLAFTSKDHGADSGPISPTLRALNHRHSHMNGGGSVAVAIPIQEIGKRQSGTAENGVGHGKDGDPMYTLQSSAVHGVAVAIHENQRGEITVNDTAGSLKVGGGKPGQGYPAIAFKPSHFTRDKDGAPSEVSPPLAADADKGDQEPLVLSVRGRGDSCDLETRRDGTANSLLTPSGGRAGMGVGAIALPMAVRRLTPVECERLMGWPDDWTAGFSDGTRYKMCGNGVVASVSAWIGKRVAAHLTCPDRSTTP